MQFLILILIGASALCHEALAGTLQPLRTNTFNFPFVDTVFDSARSRLYAINAASNQIVAIRLADGVAERTFTFNHAPETLALRPDGRFLYASMPVQPHNSYWFDAHTGYVGEINLETSTKTQEWQIDVDPYDILATDDGWVIVPDGSAQWTDVAIYRAGSGTRSGRGSIRQTSHVALHPSQTRFYSADTDLSPSDIMSWRFDKTTGAITAGFDSPYHGDYPMGGGVYTHPNGTNLLTAGGALYTSSDVQSEDMRYIRTLAGGPVSAVYFDALHNATFTSGNSANWFDTPRLQLVYYGATFEPVSQWDFTDPVSYISGDTNFLYLLSVRPDKTVLTVYANPAAGAETNSAPVASFNFTPNAPTTLSTISLDASASSDDGGSTNLLYRWDFQADGSWDVPYTNTAVAQVRYNIGGTKTIRLEVMDRFGVTSRQEKTINVPFAPDPGTPGGTNVSFTIPFAPADLVADTKRFHLFATDTFGKRMVVLNLTNGFIEREFTFQQMPESMCITPNGSNLYVAQITRLHSPYWFSSQTGYVAQFDLATLTKIREIRIEADPAAIVATDNGLLGITGGSDQWTEVQVINGLTGQRLSGASIYMSARLALHPSQNAMYTGDVGLSPADHRRFSFDPITGANLGFWDSPYHGDYSIYGQPFPTPDGRYIISQGGVVLSSSPSQSFDLRFVQNLEGGMFSSLAFDTTNQAIFTVGGSWNTASTFRYYNANFELVRSEPLTSEATRIFASAEKLWLVGNQGSNTVVFVRPNPALGALSNATPVANFSINPTAPTTLDYIQFDGGLSTDEDAASLQYRWDWQADGTYDTTFTNNAHASFRFIGPGSHTVRLQIKDRFGVLAQVDRAFTVTAGFDPGAALTQTNAPFQLPFVANDAAFDPLQPRLFALDNSSNRLVVVNLETGMAEREFRFDFKPEAIAITPNGLKMYVALITGPHTFYSGLPHRGFVAEFTLNTLGKTREFEAPIDPNDIVATDSGRVIISDGSDQWTEVAVFDATTAQKLGSSSVYMGLRLALHPNQTTVYGGETGVSPAGFTHFDISSTGSFASSWDSVYYGNYILGGKPFIFPDASGIFGPSGVVLSVSPNQTFDLKYLRTMPINGITDAAFDSARKVMAAAAAGSKVVFYDYQNNSVIVERPVPGAAFVGMRNGRAAVLANGASSSKISFFRIPAQTIEENLAPTITLDSPTNGAVVAVGAPLTVNYVATDEDGDVKDVKILNGGVVMPLTDNTILFTNAGVFDLKAVATDNFNVSGTSQVARVTATFPPTVAITEPAPDSVLISPFTVRIAINATDSDGSIARVRLYDNGQLLKTFTAAPFVFDLPAATPAIHNIYAETTDNLGITSVSTAVRFVVGGYGADNLTSDIIVLGGVSQAVYDNTVRATRQKYEPNHGGNGGGRSLWWAWKAPANGVAVVSTAGSDFDTLLGVYTWSSTSSLQNLAAVASNDDDPAAPPASRVKFNATLNTTYFIAVDGRDGFAGNVLLSISEFTSESIVPNDKFANAEPILVNSTNTAKNVGATREAFEPAHAGNNGGASVWWFTRMAQSGTIEISTEGSDFDTLLAVYTGGSTSPIGLTPVASNDDASASLISSKVTFQASPFVSYYIAVDGYNGASGNIRLTSRFLSSNPTSLPANDNFTNAIVIARPTYVTNTSSLYATAEPNEPLHAGQAGGRSLWWSWTAPVNGPVYLSTRASSIDTLLAVYTGTSLSNLTQVAANDDDPAGLRTSSLYFEAVAGTRYRIAVDGFNGVGGNIVLALNQTVTEPPRLAMQMQNSNLLLSAEGAASQIVIEQSFDLVSWEVAATVQPGEMVSIPTQPIPDSPKTAFFRVKALP